MADQSENILQHLQQFGIQPPAHAFEKAWKVVAPEKPQSATAATEREIFSNLQSHAQPAPSLNYNKLKTRATATTSIETTPVKHRILNWRAVAAILISLAISVFYFTVLKKDSNPNPSNTIAKNAKAGTDTAAISMVPGGVKPEAVTTDSSVRRLPINENNRLVFASSYLPKKRSSTRVVFPNGTEAKLYENDILFTLTSYSSKEWDQFFSSAIQQKKVSLSRYAYMDISDAMLEMLQDTYLTKKNGDPSRKAKKTKKKFEKWRKKDEKFFDKNMQKNPADIIDLSDLIL